MKLPGIVAADDRVEPEEVVVRIVVRLLHLREAILGGELLDVRARRQGEHADVDLAELAAAAGLLLVAVHALGVGLDRLAVGDLGLLGLDLHLVAALEPLAEDLQVQLAHPVDHHFLGLHVEVAAEGAVFLGDLGQGAGELALVAAALGRGGQADHRRREGDRRHGVLAERAAGLQFLDLGHGHDPARARLVDRLRLGSPACGTTGPA